jgi:hypothetical protein
MASSRSASLSRRTKSTQSTEATDVSSNTKWTSVYDDTFEQYMIDNGIYPEGYEYLDGRLTPKPENMD